MKLETARQGQSPGGGACVSARRRLHEHLRPVLGQHRLREGFARSLDACPGIQRKSFPSTQDLRYGVGMPDGNVLIGENAGACRRRRLQGCPQQSQQTPWRWHSWREGGTSGQAGSVPFARQFPPSWHACHAAVTGGAGVPLADAAPRLITGPSPGSTSAGAPSATGRCAVRRHWCRKSGTRRRRQRSDQGPTSRPGRRSRGP